MTLFRNNHDSKFSFDFKLISPIIAFLNLVLQSINFKHENLLCREIKEQKSLIISFRDLHSIDTEGSLLTLIEEFKNFVTKT